MTDPDWKNQIRLEAFLLWEKQCDKKSALDNWVAAEIAWNIAHPSSPPGTGPEY